MSDNLGTPGLGGAIFAVIGIWSVVGLGVYVWYLWALARLFPMLGLPSSHGWIPVWNQWQLVQRGGLPGWLVLFGLVPGLSIVALVVSIIAIHRINQEHGEGTGMTVLGALVAPLWATLLGSRLRDPAYSAGSQPGAASAARGLVEYGPDGQVYPILGADAQPAAPTQQPATGLPPVAPATPAPAQQQPQAMPAAGQSGMLGAPGESGLPGVPAAPPSSQGAPAAQNPWGFGNTTEGNFQRLANESQPRRDPSFGASADARPFSWPELAPLPPQAQRDAAAPGTGQPAASGDAAWTPPAPQPEPAAPAPVEPAIPETVAETRVTATSQDAQAPAAPLLPQIPAPPAAPSVSRTPEAPAAPAPPAAPAAADAPAPVAPAPVASAPVVPAPVESVSDELDPPFVHPNATAPRTPVAPVASVAPPEPAAPAEPVAPPEPVVPVEPLIPADLVIPPAPRAEAPPVAPAPEPAQAPAEAPEPAAPAPAPAAPAPAAHVPAPAAAQPSTLLPTPQQAEAAAQVDLLRGEDELDSTVMVPRRARWVIELPDGRELELPGDDVVVGRKPVSSDAEVLVVPDPTRTLSKSHARLRRSGEEWTIEDLNSTNGVFLIDEAGQQTELDPGAPVRATERLVIGTLEVRLRPSAQ